MTEKHRHSFTPAPLSVVIIARNAAQRLPFCLDAVAAGATAGLVRDVIVSDGGSSDATAEIADRFGARLVVGAPGRGGQLRAGAGVARGDWLLFLHGDTVLAADWVAAAGRLIDAETPRAGVFRLRFDVDHWRARLVAAGAIFRTRIFASPYGDQGLLMPRAWHDDIGGYRDMPLFEDVDIIDRLIKAKGRAAVTMLDAAAITSAVRYEQDGYLKRVLKNAACLAMYRAGRPPEAILDFYLGDARTTK